MATNSNNGKSPKAPNHTGWYSTVFNAWQVKALGPKPTNEQLGVIHALGARPGKQAMANAMALRDGGVSGNQIKGASALFDGNPTPQLNKMRGFVDVAGVLAWVPLPSTGDGKVYRTKLTDKGRAMIKTMADRPLHSTPSLKAATGKAVTAPKPAAPKGPVHLTSKAKMPKGAPKATASAKRPATTTPASEAPKPTEQAPAPRMVMTEAGPKPLVPASQADGK